MWPVIGRGTDPTVNAATKRSVIARKPVNLSMSAKVLADAKALKLNLSRIAEDAVVEAVRSAKFEKWREENAEALAASRERVRKRGALLDGFRRF